MVSQGFTDQSAEEQARREQEERERAAAKLAEEQRASGQELFEEQREADRVATTTTTTTAAPIVTEDQRASGQELFEEQREADRVATTSSTPGEDPVAEQRELAAKREAEEAAKTLTDRQRKSLGRSLLTEIARRELARGGQTDEAAGTIRTTREDFERRQRSKVAASEAERSKAFAAERKEAAELGFTPKRLRELRNDPDANVRVAAELGIDLKQLRNQGEVNTIEQEQLTQVQGAIDVAKGKSVARAGADIAGDIGLSIIPIFGTIRDSKRVAANWDEASTGQRTLDVGLLTLSAAGDALTVFGVGTYIKSAVATVRTSTKVVTAAGSSADELAAIARASRASQKTISKIEIEAVPDPKLADEAIKLTQAFPKQSVDIITDGSNVGIKSAGRLDEVIQTASKGKPKRANIVLELDNPRITDKNVQRISAQIGDVAQGVPTPLVKGNVTKFPTPDAKIIIRRVDRGFSEESIASQAVETAKLARITGDTRSFTTIRKQTLKELREKARREEGARLEEATKKIESNLRRRGLKDIEFEDVQFDTTRAVTVRLDKALSDKEITKLVQELEQQAGRIPTPVGKTTPGFKAAFPSKGREILIEQAKPGAAINKTRNKLIAALKRKKLDVKRQKDERVLRLTPEEPSAGSGSAFSGGTPAGRGRGNLAILEKPKTARPSTARAPKVTERRIVRADGRTGPRRRPLVTSPTPGRSPGGADAPGGEPDRAGDPSPTPDPDATPVDNVFISDQPDKVPDPDEDKTPEPDPTPDPVPDFVPAPDPDKPPDPTGTIPGDPAKPKGKGKIVPPVKAAPDLQTKDGKQLHAVIFNFRTGATFKQHDIRTGKTKAFKRIPPGGIESGRTPQATLKAVGFDESKPKRSRFKISTTVDAIIQGRRISFAGKKQRLTE